MGELMTYEEELELMNDFMETTHLQDEDGNEVEDIDVEEEDDDE
jgi:hypothetical protein